MKTNKLIIFTSLGALSIATIFLIGSSNASNFDDFNQRKSAIHSMSEIKDYGDLLEKIKGTKLNGKITEDKFNEMRNKYLNRRQNRETIEKAIRNHDYITWSKLHKGNDILKKINSEEKFKKLIEMHAIIEDAKMNMESAREKAYNIAEELGIEKRMRQDQRNKQGLRSMRGEYKGNYLINKLID